MIEIVITIIATVLFFILILIVNAVAGALIGAFVGWLLGYTPLAPPILKVWLSLAGSPCALWEFGMFIGFTIGLARSVMLILTAEEVNLKVEP